MVLRQNLDIMDMFDFPERLKVLVDPEFQRRLRCYVDGSWLSAQCTGQRRSDFVRVLRQYVPHWFVEEEGEACNVDFRKTRPELTVVHVDPAFSLMTSGLTAFASSQRRKHPCIKAVDTSQTPFGVILRAKSKLEMHVF